MDILEELRRGVSTASAEETQTLAGRLAGAVPADITLALHGDLGVGKTTFVQGLARGLGVTASVASPTFAIYNLYHGGPGPAGRRWLLAHLDAYRVESAEEYERLLLDDFLKSPYCLAVEWPEKIARGLSGEIWHLDLGIAPDRRHTVRLRTR